MIGQWFSGPGQKRAHFFLIDNPQRVGVSYRIHQGRRVRALALCLCDLHENSKPDQEKPKCRACLKAFERREKP